MALDVVCTGLRRYARVGIRDRVGRSRPRAMVCWLEDFEKLGCFHRRAKDHAPKGKVDFEDYRHLISPVSSTPDRRNVHLPADHVWALSRCSLLLTLLISVTQNKTRRHEPAGFKRARTLGTDGKRARGGKTPWFGQEANRRGYCPHNPPYRRRRTSAPSEDVTSPKRRRNFARIESIRRKRTADLMNHEGVEPVRPERRKTPVE
jgi:hypothetical protein